MSTQQNIQEIINTIHATAAVKSPEAALQIAENSLRDTAAQLTPQERALLFAEKGKMLWRLEHRGEAMSAYQQGAVLDPEGPAAMLLDHSRSIMDFFNPDLLNP